jgi:hypothetical protein
MVTGWTGHDARARRRGAGQLGEAAYITALEQGAVMDDHEVADYALGEFRRVAALIAEPGA